MANRTVQILGQGYGASPAQVTVTANGNTVFSGSVSSIDQPVPSLPSPGLNLSEILCTFEIDQAFTGQIPMTCEVTVGTVIFSTISVNYVMVPNPIYTAEQYSVLTNPTSTDEQRNAIILAAPAVPPLSAEDIALIQGPDTPPDQYIAVLNAHNLQSNVNGGVDIFGPISDNDPRTNVYLNGILQNPDRTDLAGTWWWHMYAGSTLSYDLTVQNAG